MRQFRLREATRISKNGRCLAGHSVLGSHGALLTFMRWADAEGYHVDPRVLELPRPKVPALEPDVYHIDQVRSILDACNPALPQERLAVRILVGSGVRASELCGLALAAPDGQSDILMDRLPDSAELRIRWNAGAKGQKSRRVPVVSEMAVTIRHYLEQSRRLSRMVSS